MECDMCGSSEPLFKTEVEGSFLNVCSQCAKHGNIISRVKTEEEVERINTQKSVSSSTTNTEPVETIVNDYSSLIKTARESRGMKQEDVAKKINEKESVLHHAENAEGSLSIALAKKLGRFFGIKLVELENYEYTPEKHEESGELTIGDMIKKKK